MQVASSGCYGLVDIPIGSMTNTLYEMKRV